MTSSLVPHVTSGEMLDVFLLSLPEPSSTLCGLAAISTFFIGLLIAAFFTKPDDPRGLAIVAGSILLGPVVGLGCVSVF